MNTLYKVTGNTYYVKGDLRACGFSWNASMKRWEGGEEAKAELERKMAIKHIGRELRAAQISTVECQPQQACYYCGCPATGFSMGEPACEDCGA